MFFFLITRPPPTSTLFPYTTLFRSMKAVECYSDALPLMRPPGERVAIDFSDQQLFGVLRKPRSEEHTSELQSHHDLVCRLLLEKKKKKKQIISTTQPCTHNKST